MRGTDQHNTAARTHHSAPPILGSRSGGRRKVWVWGRAVSQHETSPSGSCPSHCAVVNIVRGRGGSSSTSHHRHQSLRTRGNGGEVTGDLRTTAWCRALTRAAPIRLYNCSLPVFIQLGEDDITDIITMTDEVFLCLCFVCSSYFMDNVDIVYV